MVFFPNHFTDSEIPEERKTCGKCHKLDRTRKWCERHEVELQSSGKGISAVFFKCEKCNMKSHF